MKQRNSDRRRISFAIVALTCSLHSLASGQAQTSPQIVHGFNQVAISPNASYVAWVGPLMAMTPETGVIGGRIYEQRLTLADVATGKTRQLSPPDLYVYEYDWSPDGKSFAATAAHGAGDDNWYVAQLYTLALASGEMKSIYKPPLQIAVPRWSPEGKTIAFIAGLMSDEGSTV